MVNIILGLSLLINFYLVYHYKKEVKAWICERDYEHQERENNRRIFWVYDNETKALEQYKQDDDLSKQLIYKITVKDNTIIVRDYYYDYGHIGSVTCQFTTWLGFRVNSDGLEGEAVIPADLLMKFKKANKLGK